LLLIFCLRSPSLKIKTKKNKKASVNKTLAFDVYVLKVEVP